MNLSFQHFRTAALTTAGVLALFLGGCSAIKIDHDNFSVWSRHVTHDIPHYPIDVPVDGDVRTPLYEFNAPMVRVSDSQFVFLRRKKDIVELQLNDARMNVKWLQSLAFTDPEFLSNMSLLNGRVIMIDNRYTKGDELVAQMRTFDPRTGNPLESKELDRVSGNTTWLGGEKKKGNSPYSVYFAADSSHVLLFTRDYTPKSGSPDEKALSYHAVVYDSSFNRVGAIDIPVRLRTPQDIPSGIWPSRRGYIYSAARRSADSLWVGRYDPRNGSLIERMFALPPKADGSKASELGLDIGLTTNEQDEAIVAITGVLPGTQTVREVDLVKFSPENGTVEVFASYAPSPSTLDLHVDESTLENFRVRDIVRTPNKQTLVMLEQIFFDRRFAPSKYRGGGLIGAIASSMASENGFSFGPLYIVAYDSTGANAWATGFLKKQPASKEQAFTELGFRRYFEGDSLLHIVYLNRDDDQGIVWQKIQLKDGRKRTAYAPMRLGQYWVPTEYMRSFTTWLNRGGLLVTAIDGDGFDEDADVIVYSINPKGNILDRPEPR